MKEYFSILFTAIFNRIFFQKFVSLALLVIFFLVFQNFLALFFMTFIFAYLFLGLGNAVTQKLANLERGIRNTRTGLFIKKHTTLNTVVTILYILFIITIVTIITTFVDPFTKELKDFTVRIPELIRIAQESIISPIEKQFDIHLGISEQLNQMVTSIDYTNLAEQTISLAKNIGVFLTKLFGALILSYIFIIDRKRITSFLAPLEKSNFAFIHREYSIIFRKINDNFGVIFKAQAIIALVNALLTSIGLAVIAYIGGIGTFPYALTLALIVFILGFIPVIGMFLSAIPILLVGFGNGGILVAFACVGMIAFIHAVEAYYLNPKIVSSYMHFPIFLTFLILLVSEHFFGLVGLLIGVPLFAITLSFAQDFNHYLSQLKHEIRNHDITQ